MQASIHQRVVAKINEGIEKIEKHYGVKLPMPKLVYFKTGTTAGWANYTSWTMKLHEGLLCDGIHTEEMVTVTTPHELAHLACDKIYPDTNVRGRPTITRTGRFKRGKREVHGPHWREIMAVLGADSSRCHDMDASDFAKPKAKFDYKCITCARVYTVGPKIHAQLTKSPNARWCKCQRGPGTPLQLVAALGKVTYREAREIRAGSAPTPVVKPVVRNVVDQQPKKTGQKLGPTGDSKSAQCWRLFTKYYPTGKYERKAIIEFFVTSAGCTPAGAATYYANCKKMHEEGYI